MNLLLMVSNYLKYSKVRESKYSKERKPMHPSSGEDAQNLNGRSLDELERLVLIIFRMKQLVMLSTGKQYSVSLV